MSVVIRMRKMGTLKKPHHRIVVTDKRSPRDGRFIEDLGYYDPSRNPPFLKVNKERAEYWISVGAQPSPTIKSILKKAKVNLKANVTN